MMRLPYFRYVAPRTVAEAAKHLAGSTPDEVMLLAGGTDLLPNMKRRQQVPKTVVALRGIEELRAVNNGNGLRIGAGLTLTSLVRDERVREQYRGLWQAAVQVATSLGPSKAPTYTRPGSEQKRSHMRLTWPLGGKGASFEWRCR